jgi:hypothetical protein
MSDESARCPAAHSEAPMTPQREHFAGAERLSPAWTLTKGRKRSSCEVWSHQFGFELRLLAGSELLQSQVCRTQEDLITYQEAWRAALEAKGWIKPSA